MLSAINRLRQMSVGELQVRWRELYGEECRSRNKSYLWRRLAWRVQELAQGGLSDCARARLAELAPEGFTRARTPTRANVGDVVVAQAAKAASRPARDHRLPTTGSVISKRYKGHELRVLVRDDGFEFDGTMYDSLTAIAKHVTGSKNINGRLFWGLTQRKRKA